MVAMHNFFISSTRERSSCPSLDGATVRLAITNNPPPAVEAFEQVYWEIQSARRTDAIDLRDNAINRP